MQRGVACATQRDQVLLGIVAGLTTKLFVVNLEVGRRAAGLASPAVPAEHLVAKPIVRFGSQAQTFTLWFEAIHEIFSVA
jgi:hypothetical protein